MQNYSKAIQKGKEFMQASSLPGNDSIHASNAEMHGLEIAKEFNYPNLDLVRVVIWWHDVYKSTQSKPGVLVNLLEGPRASKIARKYLSEYLSEKELKLVLDSIYIHPYQFVYLLIGGLYSPLTQILLEADSLEDLRKERLELQLKNTQNPFLKISMWFGNSMEIVALKLIAKSNYSKNIIKSSKEL